MQKERVRCLIAGLKKFELIDEEKTFLSFAEKNLDLKGPLAEKIESALETIYRKKTEFIRSSIFLLMDHNKGISFRA